MILNSAAVTPGEFKTAVTDLRHRSITNHREGGGNLSIFLHSTARENFKLMTNGSLAIPIAQMALPLATTVLFLNELGNPGIV